MKPRHTKPTSKQRPGKATTKSRVAFKTTKPPRAALLLKIDVSQSPDLRAREIEEELTDDERFSLLVSVAGSSTVAPAKDKRFPDDVTMCTSYTPGIPRLGVPALLMSDSSMGIVNLDFRPGDTATALPASIMLASSFNPELARAGGGMIGREARSRGFNVQLAGGANLARDPRNGRNFEYLGEDPLVTAVLVAGQINGIQDEGVISTIKHYSLNCNEVMRHWLDAVIDPAAHRESDLLAFEIAIERSRPGSVMTGYNKVNGEYAGGNAILINDILKNTWGYPGWVMSDWGATPSWEFALKGLDQESGVQLDALAWKAERYAEPFVGPLKAAYADGKLSKERLSDMVRRILRSMFAVGIDAWRPGPRVDMAAHNEIALETARQGMVLLKNDDILPIATDTTDRIAVIGGYAQVGVPIGFGSSAVVPPGGYASRVPIGGPGVMGVLRNLNLLPSSPLEELRKLLPNAYIEFDPGISPVEAALLAKRSDIAIVFGIRVEGEGYDNADISLPLGQDAIIEAVAAVNPNTIVVLETGNPVRMPWQHRVKGIIEAWYPGQAGGQAIAEILAGRVNPSGRLPITFPVDLDQTPRPKLEGLGTLWPPPDRFAEGKPTTIRYGEGAEVGYRWFAKRGKKPLYYFGHGLSYTTFGYSILKVSGGQTVTASFTVTNNGERGGADVPQVYLVEAAGEKRMRLLGFERVELKPGESKRVEITADPRLLARYDGKAEQWSITEGTYHVALGKSAGDLVLASNVSLKGRRFGK